MLHQVHDALGHNSIVGTNLCLKQLYYWEILFRDAHVKQCTKCSHQNLNPQHYAQLNLEVPMMDLIGKFNLSLQGHQYALAVIDILMNYIWCILLHTKDADKVVHTY